MKPYPTLPLSSMSLSARLIALRKEKGFTQQSLADRVGLHVNQIKRYEAGTTQPSLDALRGLAQVFSVTTDFLLFEDAERGPDEALKLKFEALRQFDQDERHIAEGVLDSLIVQHQARRLFTRSA
jgi:transcriptional regulator with XRE-family HTH domain